MYNFDEIIDRQHTNALNTDGFRDYIFHADASMSFPYKDEEFIRMWVADMEFATPDVIIDAIKERLDKRIFGYTQVYEDSYYQSFKAWCERRYNWSFPKEQLVMSNGIVPALFELVDYICEEDDQVLFLTPSYAYFKYAAQASNKNIVCSDMINDAGYYSIDFDDLEAKAADEKTTLLILCNPQNPTGRVFTQAELERLAAIIEKHQLWVVSDEIHCDLLRLGKQHIPLGKVMPDYSRLITCMATSKTFNLAGMMISNVIIRDKDLRQIWLSRHYNFDNPLSIAATQAAYEHGEPWLEELRAYLDANFAFSKDYFAKHLPLAQFTDTEATYLAWVNIGAYFEAGADFPHFFAYKAGVLLEGGDKMFVQHAQGCIRLNLACPRATLAEGLKRICDAVKAHAAAPIA